MKRVGDPQDDLCIVALAKGDERYIILYDVADAIAACCQLGRWASDPRLSLTWHEAAYMAQLIRQEANA